jgi:predicted  nucleic acid-binding Zn-ribbon protein
MATLQNFDAEIEKTRQVVDDMRSKIEQSGIVLEKFSKADQAIGDADFDIENARIQDVLRQQKVMEGNIADLIIGLEDATNVFGAEFESMKSYSGFEKLIGLFSKQRMQRMRSDRVRNMSLAGNLQELLAKSDTIVGILTNQKDILDQRYSTSEDSLRSVIERRKNTMSELETTQKRIEELNPMLLDMENRIAATTNQKDRTELEGERSKLATEYNEMQAREQTLLAESQTLERYTSMFQTFVDSLNNQIAAQQTLINKLTIDTEQRIVLYKSLEDSLKTAAQQDVAHKINTLGSQVDTAAETTMAGIGAAAQKHIGDLLEMHEKNMVATQDIQRRKKLADEAFARRFDEVMKKHDAANYVRQ